MMLPIPHLSNAQQFMILNKISEVNPMGLPFDSMIDLHVLSFMQFERAFKKAEKEGKLKQFFNGLIDDKKEAVKKGYTNGKYYGWITKEKIK